MSVDFFTRGQQFMQGKGVPHAPERGVEAYRAGAEQGCTLCMWALGQAYERGNGITKDIYAAEQWYKKSAELGEDEARYALGKLLHSLKRTNEAYEWFNRGAIDGHDLCLLAVGIACKNGIGCEVDLVRAEESFKAAHDRGCDEAAMQLAILFAERGGESNLIKAKQIAKESDDVLSPRSWMLQSKLQRLLDGSSEVTKASLRAAMQAADLGDIDACEFCGEALASGVAGITDDHKAAHYLDVAIASGRSRAMVIKAIMLANGQGMRVDHDLACKLLEEAIHLGDVWAKSVSDRLSNCDRH